ncbi:MAG TPA: signal peptidase I [Verrucomicrobiae bacterium]|nr:signal peptidase I [Verrucomicrobiae bacterium]
MILRWFFSRAVREACALRKHVKRLLNAQRDLMTPAAVQIVQDALGELQRAISNRAKGQDLRIQMDALEKVAGKWLRPYPHAAWRENVEVLLVALAVAMGIRTFFLQPFKIPTGSMQPTLYGVTSVPDFSPSTIDFSASRQGIESQVRHQIKLRDELQIPDAWGRFKEWFEGVSYLHVVAQNDGTLQIGKPLRFLIFNIEQTIAIGGKSQIIWFPPDFGEQPMERRAGLSPDHVYHKGEDVIKMEVTAGDHLFVDRLTYNFRRPERGEIVVFETAGIPEEMRHNPPYWDIPNNQFYIKRLVGLGGETISIHQDYLVTGAPVFDGGTVPVGNLVANGRQLTASTPHFENLYAFSGVPEGAQTIPFVPNHYYGHAMIRKLAPGHQFQIRPDCFFVMGDNTMNSLDSRFWGDFPESYVIGKSFFVYWPLTKRFGIGQSITAR